MIGQRETRSRKQSYIFAAEMVLRIEMTIKSQNENMFTHMRPVFRRNKNQNSHGCSFSTERSAVARSSFLTRKKEITNFSAHFINISYGVLFSLSLFRMFCSKCVFKPPPLIAKLCIYV